MEERLVIGPEPQMADSSGEAERLGWYAVPVNRFGRGDEGWMMRS